MIKLVIVEVTETARQRVVGAEFPVAVPRFFIGREQDCQLRPKSADISRHHCVITQEGEELFVRDLGSSNGTFVNGQKLSGETKVKIGDRVQVGPFIFEIQLNEVELNGDATAAMAETRPVNPT